MQNTQILVFQIDVRFCFQVSNHQAIPDRHSGYDPLVTTPTGRSEDYGQGEGGQIEHWKLWDGSGKWKVNR